MKEQASKALDNWLTRFMASDGRARLVVALGVAGMALILISGLWGRESKPAGSQGETTAQQYAETTEKRLERLLAAAEGVGQARVMITLESGAETVYAQDRKQTADKTMSYAEGSPSKVEEKEGVEQNYIMVDGASGRRQALPLTQREPTIKGVVVVCPGARDPVVRERVTAVVTTALGIRSIQVCVVPSAK